MGKDKNGKFGKDERFKYPYNSSVSPAGRQKITPGPGDYDPKSHASVRSLF